MGDINIFDFMELFKDLKSDVKQLLTVMTKNADLRKDFKRFLAIMEKMTKEENMRAFRKFVNELDEFNKNAEKIDKELKELLKQLKGE